MDRPGGGPPEVGRDGGPEGTVRVGRPPRRAPQPGPLARAMIDYVEHEPWLTQRQYAARLGISDAQLSRVLNGRQQLSVPLLVKVLRDHPPFARYAGAHFVALAFGEDRTPTP